MFKFKIKNKEENKKMWGRQAGVTYVELIVVLSIFSILSSVAIYNYGAFQDRVDIKGLASDIALKIVEAQKSALSGKVSELAPSGWKPSYGVYFNSATTPDVDGVIFNKKFDYFVDLDSNGILLNPSCNAGRECLEKILIPKGNIVSSVGITGFGCPSIDDLNIVFERPDFRAIVTSSSDLSSCNISYAQVVVTSPRGTSSTIKIYPSGRIQIN